VVTVVVLVEVELEDVLVEVEVDVRVVRQQYVVVVAGEPITKVWSGQYGPSRS